MTASKATKKKQAAKEQRRREKARRIAEERAVGASTKVVEITDARPAVLAGIRAALTARSAGRPRAASRAPAFEEEKRTGHIDWTEALRDKPVDDLLDGIDLGSVFRRKDAVDSVVSWLEQGTYRGWEAALRAEQQLPLTDAHEEALDELVSVSDDDEDGTVLYIDDRARPSEPWYATVRRLAPHLVVEGIDSSDVLSEDLLTMGETLVDAVVDHAEGLSLASGCSAPVDVFPAGLAHRLRVQAACYELLGIGQVFSNGTRNALGDRAAWFEEALAERADSLRALDWTIDDVLRVVLVPEPERTAVVAALRGKPIFPR